MKRPKTAVVWVEPVIARHRSICQLDTGLQENLYSCPD
jgi:hypothetical protein